MAKKSTKAAGFILAKKGREESPADKRESARPEKSRSAQRKPSRTSSRGGR